MLALQITAAAFALLGAWLLRKPGRWWAWAFVAWCVSNPAAMLFMAVNGYWWMFLQHVVFLWLAIESVWHWLVAPQLHTWWGHTEPVGVVIVDEERS